MMFERCDLDGNGKLDFEEFKKMMMKNKLVIKVL